MIKLINRLSERYRFIRPVLASMIVVVFGVVTFGVGKGYDLLFGESYPLYHYPYFADLTWGDIITASLVTLFIVGIISYQLTRFIHESKAKKETK